MDTKLVNQFTANTNEIEKVQAQIVKATVQLQTKLKTLQEKDQAVRAAMKEAMIKNNVKKYENDLVSITLVSASTRKSLDSARLKEEAPGIYDKYLKETEVAASVRIKVKAQEI
jgi:predicted phage-related endonuclease